MTVLKTALLAASVSVAALSSATAENLKIAYIDPLSGPFGPTGETGLLEFTYAADKINEAGGINGQMVEIVGYDNKINPQESLVQLQKAIDSGIRIIAQGNGSSVAAALIDAINKHNKRNPGDEVLFLNYAAVDPAFTNDMCSFWHFRFDADADMKMNGITDWIKGRDDIKKVYVIGQDYNFGKAVAAAAVSQLAEKRPDIEIVGNELHPLGKVKDFTPYVQKIVSSGADAVITGNWGADMVLLIKAATESGFDKPILTYYAGSRGVATAMGASAVGQVKAIVEGNYNYEMSPEQTAYFEGYRNGHPDVDFAYPRVQNAMEFLDTAAEKAGSNNVKDIAFAMEGMEIEGGFGKVTMRADNHQAVQPLYMVTFSDDVKYDVEHTGLGWANGPGDVIPAEATVTETTCNMERPS